MARRFGGINLRLGQSRLTIKSILELSEKINLVYLPSHDPMSGQRLFDMRTTRPKRTKLEGTTAYGLINDFSLFPVFD